MLSYYINNNYLDDKNVKECCGMIGKFKNGKFIVA